MDSPNQLSFLPDDYLAGKARARANLICAVLFLVVMVALGAVFTVVEGPLREARQVNTDIAKRYAEAARPIEQFKKMQDKQRQVTSQAELTASLLEKMPRSVVLAEITNALPGGVSLAEFALESKPRAAAPAPAGPPVPKTQFELKKGTADAQLISEPRQFDVLMRVTGFAYHDEQVAQFMTALMRCESFRDVNLVISDEFEHDKEKVRRFQIEVTINPEATAEPSEGRPRTLTASTELREAK